MDKRLTNKNLISDLYKKHLLVSVGNKPSKKEIIKIEKIMYESHRELDSNKEGEVRRAYNKKLAKIWPKIIAEEDSPEEILIFSKKLSLNNNLNITSLGSGMGILEMFIAKYFCPKGNIICIDFSREMLSKGKVISKKLKIKNIRFLNKSAAKNNLTSNSQDIVLSRRTGFASIDKWEEILKEIKRIIKKNEQSRFVYTTLASSVGSLQKFKSHLKGHGFEFLSLDNFLESDGTKVSIIIFKLARRKN